MNGAFARPLYLDPDDTLKGALAHIAEQRLWFIWIHFMRRQISKYSQFWRERELEREKVESRRV